MIADLFSIFFPKNCISCSTNLVKGEKQICLNCYTQIPFRNAIFNEKNNSLISNYSKQIGGLFNFDKKGVSQSIIHEIKYNKNFDLALFMGEILGRRLQKESITFNAIIPVPLHKKKLKKRGFNQSEKIANGISKQMKISILKHTLIRTENTETQTKKNRQERIENVKNAFLLKQKNIPSNTKSILLVDDVITTGSTLNECARVINQQNIIVYSVSLGIA